MKNKELHTNHAQKTAVVFCLGLLYAWLFNNAEVGLNLLIFDAVLILALLRVRPELSKHQGFVWSIGGLLFSALSVVVVHSGLSVGAHHLTFLLVVGFAQARELRFLLFAFLLGVAGIFEGPLNWLKSRRQATRAAAQAGDGARVQGVGKRAWQTARLVALPALLIAPFLMLYAGGNTHVASLLETLAGLADDVSLAISHDAWWYAVLTVFGMLLTGGLFFHRVAPSVLTGWQVVFTDHLTRRNQKNRLANSVFAPQPPSHLRPRRKIMGLVTEYKQGVITFGLLNLLLALVNATDLRFVWLDGGGLDAATLSRYVHEGTTNLILSIALAMGLVTWYFRGNLNFLSTNEYLRPLAKLWLAQNALLAFSVGVRNYRYLEAYGLAHGRVYVVFVLLLILFGLFTLWRKIDQRLSFSYLLQTNAMALWLGFLLLASVNWSGVITRYNLATQNAEAIDWNYLTGNSMADNDFLLPDAHKSNRFKIYKDWRGWNYAEWRNNN